MAEATNIAGKVVSGIAGYETGKYNRKVARTRAIEEERAGAAAVARIRDGARIAIGQQLAAQGSNGFQMGSGSALDALTESQINATLDALNARQEATARARGLRVQGDIAYAQGYNSMVQGLIGAASSAAQMNSDWASARAGSSGGGR